MVGKNSRKRTVTVTDLAENSNKKVKEKELWPKYELEYSQWEQLQKKKDASTGCLFHALL